MTRDAAPVDEPVTTKGCPDNPANREKLPGGRDAATVRGDAIAADRYWSAWARWVIFHDRWLAIYKAAKP